MTPILACSVFVSGGLPKFMSTIGRKFGQDEAGDRTQTSSNEPQIDGSPRNRLGATLVRHDGQRRRRGGAALARAVFEGQRMVLYVRAAPGAIRRNAKVLGCLTRRSEWHGPGSTDNAYQARFTANLFHLASDRIFMLALAHGSRHGVARHFERLISELLPERPMPGGGRLAADKRPYRLKPGFRAKPRFAWIAPDILDLLRAYGEVRGRWHARREAEAIIARCL